jgi:8-oxo-dGTP diphosphatase/2-hydroxy-dATP diphosphatase
MCDAVEENMKHQICGNGTWRFLLYCKNYGICPTNHCKMQKQEKLFTLLFIIKDNRILLGMKKRGFGTGKYNGFGGKVESKEDIVTAAHRELEEEAGIKAIDLQQCGLIRFEFETTYEHIMHVHVFVAYDYSGEITESEEMKPEWFDLDKIPFDNMWKDDPFWFPYLLKGSKFNGSFLFADQSTIVHHTIKETDLFYLFDLCQFRF